MSTLRSHQCNPSRVVEQARMIFSSCGKQTLVVEGEADYRLFLQWLLGEHARLEKVNGKPNVKEVWELAKKRRVGNISCMVDIDYDLVVGDSPIDDGQFIYVSHDCGLSASDAECNDLESVLIRSHALLKVMSQKYRGDELYTAFESRVDDLREALRVAASAIGAFRAADQRILKLRSLSPIGGDFSIEDIYFEPGPVRIDVAKLTASLRRSSRVGGSAMEELIEVAAQLSLDYGDGWQLCKGHDLSEMLARHVSVLIDRQVNRREIEEDLRLACELDTIRATRFGAKLLSIGESIGKPLLGPHCAY